MLAISLQSGSNGNCIYVETEGVRLLFDAGISGKQAQQRLGSHGRAIDDVDAVIISHDHADHAASMGIFHRKFGLPVYVTRATLRAARRRRNLGVIDDVRHFRAGGTLRFDGVCVETIPTPHDATDGVAFVVDDRRHRLGILTDLGHAFDALGPVIGTLDALMIESNYDPQMLAHGPYPEMLKRRVRGPGGHLSNREAADLVRDAAGERLRWVCLAHLSEQNNRPELAKRTHRKTWGDRCPIHVASRYEVSPVLRV